MCTSVEIVRWQKKCIKHSSLLSRRKLHWMTLKSRTTCFLYAYVHSQDSFFYKDLLFLFYYVVWFASEYTWFSWQSHHLMMMMMITMTWWWCPHDECMFWLVQLVFSPTKLICLLILIDPHELCVCMYVYIKWVHTRLWLSANKSNLWSHLQIF